MMDFEHKLLLYAIYVMLVFIAINTCNTANAQPAESAVIEFVDAEDLQARVDSVRNVCDTVMGHWEHYTYPDTSYDLRIDGHGQGEFVIIIDGPDSSWWTHCKPKVTCRRLVCVEVVYESERYPLEWPYKIRGELQVYKNPIPGEACVWWEEE